MYLILIGKVNLCLDTRGKNVFQRLSAGAAFADHFLWEHEHRDTAIAANYVDIAILSKTLWKMWLSYVHLLTNC